MDEYGRFLAGYGSNLQWSFWLVYAANTAQWQVWQLFSKLQKKWKRVRGK
jgi:hypothetical protein